MLWVEESYGSNQQETIFFKRQWSTGGKKPKTLVIKYSSSSLNHSLIHWVTLENLFNLFGLQFHLCNEKLRQRISYIFSNYNLLYILQSVFTFLFWNFLPIETSFKLGQNTRACSPKSIILTWVRMNVLVRLSDSLFISKKIIVDFKF